MNLKRKNCRLKNRKGITLIALIITIIVLLILAGVSIAMLTGEKGIITQANKAKTETRGGTVEEIVELWKIENEENEEELLQKMIKDKQVFENEIDREQKTITIGEREISYAIEENGKNPNNPGIGESGKLPSNKNTKPFLPIGAEVIEGSLEKGVVIKDANGNYWTWIEVPKSIYANVTYNGGTAPSSSEDYAKIESTMQKYAEAYRESGYTDEWYSEAQHGFASATEYNNHKKAMLKSVYENGGFYIGKYEVGTETLRTSSGANLTTPVIKEGAYPYNYVTNKQAQEKSKELATGGRTSSLMFGIQWDLVLKHIETKKGKTQKELKTDSTTWGNYNNATFEITKGKYSTDNGDTFTEVTGTYTKPESDVLLTTGATERNSVLNIYDLAGNISKWTLEKSLGGYICTFRNGTYNGSGVEMPASYRFIYSTDGTSYAIGFRSALW